LKTRFPKLRAWKAAEQAARRAEHECMLGVCWDLDPTRLQALRDDLATKRQLAHALFLDAMEECQPRRAVGPGADAECSGIKDLQDLLAASTDRRPR
jgi:hypothetical protein